MSWIEIELALIPVAMGIIAWIVRLETLAHRSADKVRDIEKVMDTDRQRLDKRFDGLEHMLSAMARDLNQLIGRSSREDP